MNAGFDDAKAFWDARFAVSDYIFGTGPNSFLASQRFRFQPGMRVLDIACGEGRNSVWLASLGCEVIGVDLSLNALAKAKTLARDANVSVTWFEADLREWVWQPQRFDAVISIFIQFAAPEGRAEIFNGMQRSLAPAGCVLVQGFTPRQLEYKSGGPRDVEHLYTRKLLEQSFAELEILQLTEHDEALAEGTKHRGMAALIDLVARKPA